MDPAEVVADDVLAQGGEVVAGRRRQRGGADAGERLVAAGGRRREDVVDPGQHGELGARRRLGPHRGEAERVGDDDGQRADADEAAPLGREPVGRADRHAVLDRREQHGGALRAGDRVVEAQHRRGPVALVRRR